MMAAHRLEDIETMQGYAILLRKAGHYLESFTCSADEMKQIRVKVARFIYRRLQGNGKVPDDEKFDQSVVECSDVMQGMQYYSGFVFVPSIASHFCSYIREITTADVSLPGIWTAVLQDKL